MTEEQTRADRRKAVRAFRVNEVARGAAQMVQFARDAFCLALPIPRASAITAAVDRELAENEARGYQTVLP